MKLQLYSLLGVIALLASAGLLFANWIPQNSSSKDSAPSPSALREDLFVKVDPTEDLLLDWRWKVGGEAKVFRVTVFGDIFTLTPGGQIYWLDTGSDSYVEVAKSAEQWAELAKTHEEDWFHGKTLRELQARGAKLKEGWVYSWRQPPMLGGVESADNIDFVLVRIHTSFAGRVAEATKDLPPGTKIDKNVFEAATGKNDQKATIYNVVINDELEYSIWPVGREFPAGWKSVGKTGTKVECMEYIKRVWTDMRPLSLRKQPDGQ